MFKVYRTSDLFNYFGLSRDTLPFYEGKGLEKEENESYLSYPKCLYTVAEEVQRQAKQEDLIQKMYRTSLDFANSNGLTLLGEAFAQIRLFTYEHNQRKAYIEIFIPYED